MGPFWTFFGPFGAIFGGLLVRVRFKNIFGTYLCKQSSLVLEIQPYLLFLIRPSLGPFLHFLGLWGYFWGWGQVQQLFWDLLTYTNNFYFGIIALFCFFETFSGGGGWLDIAILMKTKSSAFDFDFD